MAVRSKRTQDILEFLLFMVPGFNIWYMIHSYQELKKTRIEARTELIKQIRLSALFQDGAYIPLKYRSVSDNLNDQIYALINDILADVPLEEIFSREFEEGFTKEQQEKMDEAEHRLFG